MLAVSKKLGLPGGGSSSDCRHAEAVGGGEVGGGSQPAWRKPAIHLTRDVLILTALGSAESTGLKLLLVPHRLAQHLSSSQRIAFLCLARADLRSASCAARLREMLTSLAGASMPGSSEPSLPPTHQSTAQCTPLSRNPQNPFSAASSHDEGNGVWLGGWEIHAEQHVPHPPAAHNRRSGASGSIGEAFPAAGKAFLSLAALAPTAPSPGAFAHHPQAQASPCACVERLLVSNDATPLPAAPPPPSSPCRSCCSALLLCARWRQFAAKSLPAPPASSGRAATPATMITHAPR